MTIFRFCQTFEEELKSQGANSDLKRDLNQRKVNWQKYFFVNVFYKNFDASLWSVMDSGLIGPVRLFRMKVVEPMKTEY